jgi:hypothetical protein
MDERGWAADGQSAGKQVACLGNDWASRARDVSRNLNANVPTSESLDPRAKTSTSTFAISFRGRDWSRDHFLLL